MICPLNKEYCCDERGCAWYDEKSKQCAILSIMKALERIAEGMRK